MASGFRRVTLAVGKLYSSSEGANVKRNFWFCMALLFSMTWPAYAQEGSPAPDTGKKTADSVNAALITARAATKEKRYADSEALMLKATASQPEAILPWVELGRAQIGLKKYAEAENSFKVALGIDPASPKPAQADDFFQKPDARDAVAPSATRASRNTLGGMVTNAQVRTPEIQGVAYSSLGEIYARTGRIAEAEAAFDTAVKAFPSDAALYRRNETIFFFQVGNAEAQLEAVEKAIAVDPGRAMLYYFKGQALVSKASVDPQTHKMILPPGCAEAYQKYLELEPKGQFANDAKGILITAGLPIKGKR
jgi:tetratricopeptide (TPR) repeat protein